MGMIAELRREAACEILAALVGSAGISEPAALALKGVDARSNRRRRRSTAGRKYDISKELFDCVPVDNSGN